MQANKRTIEKATKEVVLEPPQIIEVDGKEYKLTDFNNEWNLAQEDLAKPIVTQFLDFLISKFKKESFQNMEFETDVNGKFILNAKGEKIPKMTPEAIIESYEMIKEMINFDMDSTILSIIYINKSEKHFIDETYEERKEAFKYLNIGKYRNVRLAIQSFFGLKLPSIVNDSQIYLNQLKAIMSV